LNTSLAAAAGEL